VELALEEMVSEVHGLGNLDLWIGFGGGVKQG
jgi:hypothetical protein